jgi:hypothetical protein
MPLVDEVVDQDPLSPLGASLLFYRAALPLSSRTLTFVPGSSAGTTRLSLRSM